MKKKKAYLSEKSTTKEYLGIFKGIRIPWLLYILVFAATMGSTYAGVIVSNFTGDMVDASGNIPTKQLILFSVGYLILAVCSSSNAIFSGVASEKINLAIRKKVWRKIIYTKQNSYDIDGGETLVSRVTTDCDLASTFFTTIVSFLSLAVSIGMYLYKMGSLSLKLTIYMFLLIPISILLGWGYTKLSFMIAQKNQFMLSDSTTYLIERTRNLALIKTANVQQEELAKGSDKFREQYIMQIKTGLLGTFFTSLQTVYNIISIFIPFTVGGMLVASGKMTAGGVVAFYGISTQFGMSFTSIVHYAGDIRKANGALTRVIKTLKLPDEHVEEGIELDIPDADITFENVTFRYADDPVLQDLSCVIPKNKVTAVIGANGSGKSTLFKLLNRLYDPESGTVKFGGSEVSKYNIHAWRNAFGIVAQGSPLMEGTVRENICYGCERDILEEELVEVAKRARVYDFIMKLPDGFDSKVMSGGANFSGGQRQCIAIARAMMKNPDYLLLDEATSNLDAKSESAVIEALSELMKDRTTVIIAHSLSAIRTADHVIVLADGKVQTSGSPKQVLEESNNYLTNVIGRKIVVQG